MGSFIEINDTLRINKDQGFPKVLDIHIHLDTPYKQQEFDKKVFNFFNKSKIRVYKIPPIRNFLVEEIDGKWIYWGLCHILEVKHDYVNQLTSGKFKIIYLNAPNEMATAYSLIDGKNSVDFFNS